MFIFGIMPHDVGILVAENFISVTVIVFHTIRVFVFNLYRKLEGTGGKKQVPYFLVIGFWTLSYQLCCQTSGNIN